MKVANYTDNEGGQLIMMVANYTDNDGSNYRIVCCISRDFQALISRIWIMKGGNYTDMEGGQL